MGSVMCVFLLQFCTGYGTYEKEKAIECQVQDKLHDPKFPEGNVLYLVNCKKSMDKLRLCDNIVRNDPLRFVRIGEGEQCFR